MTRLAALMEATWPAAETRVLGPWQVRRGAGGGQRVSATTVAGPWTLADIDGAEAAMRGLGQQPLFRLTPAQDDLDQALAARGYQSRDPVVLYSVPCAALCGADGPERMTTFPHWPPLAMARDLWAEGQVGCMRLAVMDRACTPKTAILGRAHDRASGVGFVAIAGGVAFVHALHVTPALRRPKAGHNILRAAAQGAARHGAAEVALAVTAANSAARALYGVLGMEVVEGYHYRQMQG